MFRTFLNKNSQKRGTFGFFIQFVADNQNKKRGDELWRHQKILGKSQYRKRNNKTSRVV